MNYAKTGLNIARISRIYIFFLGAAHTIIGIYVGLSGLIWSILCLCPSSS